MDEPGNHYATCNKPDTRASAALLHSHQVSKMITLSEQQRVEWWLPGAEGGENGDLLMSTNF